MPLLALSISLDTTFKEILSGCNFSERGGTYAMIYGCVFVFVVSHRLAQGGNAVYSVFPLDLSSLQKHGCKVRLSFCKDTLCLGNLKNII